MKPNLQPVLENELVKLRPLHQDDFNALFNVAKDPLIWKLHQCPDRYELKVFKAFFTEALQSKGAFVIIDAANNKIIGSSRYKLSTLADDAIEIGWSFLDKAYWGGVYNKAFKSLMITHAHKFFDHIIFYVDHKNIRSQKAMEKLGGIKLKDVSQQKHLRRLDGNTVTYCISKS